MDLYAAGKGLRDHHTIGAAFRTQPRRYRDHRSEQAFAVCARDGQAGEEVFDEGHPPLSVDITHHVSRVLGQWLNRVVEADAENGARYARLDVDFRMDRSAAVDHS